MKKFDEMLHTAALNCMEKEDELIRKEMEGSEKHVFSDEFNQKMDQLFADIDLSIARATKRKKRRAVLLKIAPIAAVFVIVISGLLITVNKNSVQASDPSIKITTWCKEFFSFTGEKNDVAASFTFDETQIGYIPEGFKKTEEDITLVYISFKYENEAGDFIYVKVSDSKVSNNINNTDITHDARVNKDGIEYLYLRKEKTKEIVILFQGNDKLYYSIVGTVSEEEMINIMEGIQF